MSAMAIKTWHCFKLESPVNKDSAGLRFSLVLVKPSKPPGMVGSIEDQLTERK